MSEETPGTGGAALDAHRHLAERTAFHVYKLGQLIFQAVEAGLSALSMNGRMYFILAGIQQGGLVSQQDLARTFSIDPTTIVAIVDELERAGFVRRERSTADRRRYELHLTPEGGKALDAAHEVMDAVEAELFHSIKGDFPRYQTLTRRVLDSKWPIPPGY